MAGSSTGRSSPRRIGLVADEVTGAVIGAFFEVYNTLGFGFLEQAYARSLSLELTRRSIAHACEVPLTVRYKGAIVAAYRADFVVARQVVVEVKATCAVGNADRRQLINYLRATELEVGLLLHFGPEPAFHRVVFTTPP